MYSAEFRNSVDDSRSSLDSCDQLRYDWLDVLPELAWLGQKGIGFEELLRILEVPLGLDLVV